MALCSAAHHDMEVEELSRVPELLRAMTAVRSEFWPTTAGILLEAHTRDYNQFVHVQIVNALVALSKILAVYEDFPTVENIGRALEKTVAADAEEHRICCTAGLREIMPVTSIDRVLEIFAHNRENMAHIKTTAQLLRWSGREGIEKVFQLLDEEKVTTNRLSLLRLISRIGAPAIELARLRLHDQRWYVARNAVKLLGDLKDTDLIQSVGPALGHPNQKVQKTALTVLMESRLPGRSIVIAAALGYMHGELEDEALNDLSFLKDPASLPALETFILRHSHERPTTLEKAVQVLGRIPEERSMRLLANILADSTINLGVRKQALSSLVRSKDSFCRGLVSEFLHYHHDPSDPILPEAEKAMKQGA